jgi:hypothetical protein
MVHLTLWLCSYVQISNCVNCIVFVGTVQHVLMIDRCERVKVVAAARAVRVRDTRESTVNVCCNAVRLFLQLCFFAISR